MKPPKKDKANKYPLEIPGIMPTAKDNLVFNSFSKDMLLDMENKRISKEMSNYPKTDRVIEALRKRYPKELGKFSREEYHNLLYNIGRVESKNQNIKQKGGGPGRGYFQMEESSAPIAYKRYNNLNKLTSADGDTLLDVKYDKDFTKLPKDDQAAMTLVNIFMSARNKKELPDLSDHKKTWLKYHWAGPQKDEEARKKHWEKTIGVSKMDFGGDVQFDFSNNPFLKNKWAADVEAAKNKNSQKQYRKGIIDYVGDFGKYQADTLLGSFGMGNVINEDTYSTKFGANMGNKAASVFSGVVQAAAPIVLNSIAPGSGALYSAAVQMGSKFNPQDESVNDINQVMGTVGQAAGLAEGLSNIKFKHGGNVKHLVNIEGAGQQEGSVKRMRSGELLVKDGDLLGSFVSFTPHPKDGSMDPTSTVALSGGVVIPKNRSKDYKETNKAERKLIEAAIIKRQDNKNYSGMKAKYGKAVMAGGGWSDILPSYAQPQPTIQTPLNPEYDSYLKKWGDYKFAPDATNSGSGGKSGNQNINKFGDWANKALSLSYPIEQTLTGKFGKVEQLNPRDYTNTSLLTPRFISDYATQQMINDSTNAGLNSLRRAGMYNPASVVSMTARAMNQKALSRQDIDAKNAAIDMQAQQYNAEIMDRNLARKLNIEGEINPANRAARENLYWQGRSGMSRGANQNIYDSAFFDALPMIADNPAFNKYMERLGYSKNKGRRK